MWRDLIWIVVEVVSLAYDPPVDLALRVEQIEVEECLLIAERLIGGATRFQLAREASLQLSGLMKPGANLGDEAIRLRQIRAVVVRHLNAYIFHTPQWKAMRQRRLFIEGDLEAVPKSWAASEDELLQVSQQWVKRLALLQEVEVACFLDRLISLVVAKGRELSREFGDQVNSEILAPLAALRAWVEAVLDGFRRDQSRATALPAVKHTANQRVIQWLATFGTFFSLNVSTGMPIFLRSKAEYSQCIGCGFELVYQARLQILEWLTIREAPWGDDAPDEEIERSDERIEWYYTESEQVWAWLQMTHKEFPLQLSIDLGLMSASGPVRQLAVVLNGMAGGEINLGYLAFVIVDLLNVKGGGMPVPRRGVAGRLVVREGMQLGGNTPNRVTRILGNFRGRIGL